MSALSGCGPNNNDMTSFSELANDPEFRNRWPYIWGKLEPYLLAKQRAYAAAHKGNYEDVGRFVGFMAELFDDLNTIDVEVGRPAPVRRSHR